MKNFIYGALVGLVFLFVMEAISQTPEFQKKTPAKVEITDSSAPYITPEPTWMPGGVKPDGKVNYLKLDKDGNVLAICVNK